MDNNLTPRNAVNLREQRAMYDEYKRCTFGKITLTNQVEPSVFDAARHFLISVFVGTYGVSRVYPTDDRLTGMALGLPGIGWSAGYVYNHSQYTQTSFLIETPSFQNAYENTSDTIYGMIVLLSSFLDFDSFRGSREIVLAIVVVVCHPLRANPQDAGGV